MNIDKILHNLIGFLVHISIFAALLYMSGAWRNPPVAYMTIILAAFAAKEAVRFISYAKEAYDEAHPAKHSKDMLDAESTNGGASLATALILAWMVGGNGF